MSETLSRVKAVKPDCAEVALLRVVRSEPVGPGFIRVVLTGADGTLGRTFTPMGYDQWLRLFLPARPGHPPLLPDGPNEGWYTRWLALDEQERAVCRNYTVREARRLEGGWELDIDFVVHRDGDSGEVEGVAARWATGAHPGDLVGMLDQGTIYDTSPVSGTVVVVADETGVPAAEGIARSLPPGGRAVLLLEVADGQDRRPLPSDADVDARWAVRAPGARHGDAALALLAELEMRPDDYVYAVGEASFVLAARARAQAAGVPRHSVDFCAYWRS